MIIEMQGKKSGDKGRVFLKKPSKIDLFWLVFGAVMVLFLLWFSSQTFLSPVKIGSVPYCSWDAEKMECVEDGTAALYVSCGDGFFEYALSNEGEVTLQNSQVQSDDDDFRIVLGAFWGRNSRWSFFVFGKNVELHWGGEKHYQVPAYCGE